MFCAAAGKSGSFSSRRPIQPYTLTSNVYLRSCLMSIRLRSLWAVCLLAAALPVVAQTPSSAPMAAPNSVAEGTTFLVRLDDELDTARLQQGKHFKAKLAEDLVAGDGQV